MKVPKFSKRYGNADSEKLKRTLNKFNQNILSSKHITIKRQKYKTENPKNRKCQVMYKGRPTELTADFSAKILRGQKRLE
jgi:hypothetical protein